MIISKTSLILFFISIFILGVCIGMIITLSTQIKGVYIKKLYRLRDKDREKELKKEIKETEKKDRDTKIERID